jgi:hypothetical protein
VSDVLLMCGNLLNHSVWLVKNHDSEEEYLKYRRRVAYVFGELLSELVIPIHIEHPELDPFPSKPKGEQPGQSSEETPQVEKRPDVSDPGDPKS